MKFKIKCTYQDDESGEEAWWEEYEKDHVEDPQKWAEQTIENFNTTLRPHEKPRRLLDVEILEENTKKDHSWVKTSLSMRRAGWRSNNLYDEYKCTHCGITGKRFGVGRVERDSKYRAKVYNRCDTAYDHLQKDGHPKG